MNRSRIIVLLSLFGIACATFAPISNAHQEPAAYEFYGRHFTASYKGCDSEALQNISVLIQELEKAVLASGATILGCNHVVFPGNGLTAMFLLSESHASIHTYPEHNACFVDLFTCGHTCSHVKFHALLENYLKPTESDTALYIRS